MHTFECGNAVIVHNGDYSGNVEIRVINRHSVYAAIEIPSSVLFQFVAEAVRQRKISKIGNETTGELLGLPENICK